MSNPSCNLAPVMKFAFDRAKAQLSAQQAAASARTAKAAPVPSRAAPSKVSKGRVSTRQGDALKAKLITKEATGSNDIAKGGTPLIFIR